MQNEINHANNLKASRAASFKNSLANAKKKAKAVANAVALTTYINPFMDWLFGIALAAAILKDIFDLVNTALIAAFGSGLVLIVVFSSICSFVIAAVIFLTGSSENAKTAKGLAQGMAGKMLKKLATLAGATVVEMVPGVGLLPIESLTVLIIFWMTLKDRQKAAQAEAEEKKTQASDSTASMNPAFTTTISTRVA